MAIQYRPLFAFFGVQMAKNSPAFQYYPADLISDPEVMLWNAEEVGCYWLLISYLWLNNGKTEENLENFSKIFRKKTKKTAEKIWNKIKVKFVVEDGYVVHKRVVREMQKQASTRVKRAEAGKKGMSKRWGKHNKAITSVITNGITKNNSSSSSSTSVNSNSNNSAGVSVPDYEKIKDLWNSFATPKQRINDIADFAGNLLDLFDDIGFDLVVQTIENYKEARGFKNTKSHEHVFGRFITKNYLPYRPGHYDPAAYQWESKKEKYENETNQRNFSGQQVDCGISIEV